MSVGAEGFLGQFEVRPSCRAVLRSTGFSNGPRGGPPLKISAPSQKFSVGELFKHFCQMLLPVKLVWLSKVHIGPIVNW